MVLHNMLFKVAVLIGLFGVNASEENLNLRGADSDVASTSHHEEMGAIDHLDLEVTLENGERELFPLLPGTKCPTGHTCRTRAFTGGLTNPLTSALKDNLWGPLTATMDWQVRGRGASGRARAKLAREGWLVIMVGGILMSPQLTSQSSPPQEFNNDLNRVVKSDDYCSRRHAMARAAGILAGVAGATVSSPAYAAETKMVKMGADNGQLIFDPAKITICKGDSVKWINNKGGPHNVVFDEDNIPSGVDQEAISMSEQLGEEGDTFSMSFDTAGDYDYYCEPHRGAGMNARLVVT